MASEEVIYVQTMLEIYRDMAKELVSRCKKEEDLDLVIKLLLMEGKQ